MYARYVAISQTTKIDGASVRGDSVTERKQSDAMIRIDSACYDESKLSQQKAPIIRNQTRPAKCHALFG
jgi:hypothetical protein